MFCELEIVVVRALRSSSRHVDGTEGAKREPRVGDQGAVVHVLGPDEYTVECVDHDGRTVWLADFVEGELTSPPQGWQYAVEEISAGVWRVTALGPGGMRAEATDADESLAMANCRKFALRYSKVTSGRGAG
jgi:hypothetical protein